MYLPANYRQEEFVNALHNMHVCSASPKGHIKLIHVRCRNERLQHLAVHRFAMIGQNDLIGIREGLERRVWVEGETNIPITPIFEELGLHEFAGETVETRVAEIATAAELREQVALEAFHYRGIDFSDAGRGGAGKRQAGGRRALLVLQLKLDGSWQTAGYIELQMPLMMAKPRHVAFDRPFSHPELDVTWESWRKGGQALVNRIVRIARVVVHPELRGGGLSGLLVSSAVRFARERWHIGGKRPLFVEISAEMLRHIDFVSACGFHYLGDTEGNRTRLAKDMASMNKGRKGGSGIMSLQRRYYALFEKHREATGETFESLQSRLSEVLRDENLWDKMTIDEWLALRPVIRSPIPYFMMGLDEHSDAYVRAAAVPKPAREIGDERARATSEVNIEGLEVWSDYDAPQTTYSRLVMDAFGITAKTLRTRIVGPVSLQATPGTITFVAGSSGCGKSLLLAALDHEWKSNTVTLVGEVRPRTYTAGWLAPLPDDAPLFEYLAEKHGPERTFEALARVGLSEAMLFLKPFAMLSRGQRYRAMLADLLLGDHDVWLIDEFCSDLDPLAARIVAHRLRQAVRKERRVAFVAAANHGHFIDALHPARVVRLETGGGCSILLGGEYARGVRNNAR